MSYMKQLTSIIDDLTQQPVRRDRWGRYMVLQEGALRPIGYTRATTIAKGIEDSGGLLGWGKRMVAIGLAQRPDLVALVSTTPDTDKKALDEICERAAEQGGATVRRDLGTAVHGMLERSFTDPTFVAPDPYGGDIKAVHDALASARLRVVDGYSERMIVHDRHQIAGTFDLLVEDETGQRFVADYKTGSSLLGALAFAIQLSIYANADALYNQGAAADGSEDSMFDESSVSGASSASRGGLNFLAVCWRGNSRTVNVMCSKSDIDFMKHQLAALHVLRPKVKVSDTVHQTTVELTNTSATGSSTESELNVYGEPIPIEGEVETFMEYS